MLVEKGSATKLVVKRSSVGVSPVVNLRKPLTKHASEMKTRADIIKSLKQGTHAKNLCPPKLKRCSTFRE